MARNVSKFTSVDTLDVKKVDEVTKEILGGADLKTTVAKGKGGRKPKEIKADKLIRVYVTEARKTALEEYCVNNAISESALVNQLLIKAGVF